MNTAILIHSNNKEKLINSFKKIVKSKNHSIYLHSKNYAPWSDESIKNEIVTFSKYYAFQTSKKPVDSIIELIYKTNQEKILILDEDNINSEIELLDKKEFLQKNLDTKYNTLKWFLKDIKFQKKPNSVEFENDNSEDYQRFIKKVNSNLFKSRIIYVDGGLGDHVMVLPLLEKLSPDIYICCKYPQIFEHIPKLGYVDWNDELFGGYNRFVYEYGSINNSKTIVNAFFEMYGEKRDNLDVMKFNGKKTFNSEIPKEKNIVLICTSAAKIQNQDSNKDWSDIRWFKLVHELKKKNFFVIQVGTKKDNQIPNVDLKFLDKPISELAGLIEESSLWVTVDTFFHHFASSIKPEVGICLTPYYNDHAKHDKVNYIEKDCGKNYYDRRWWLDLQQPERKECMELIDVEDVLNTIY